MANEIIKYDFEGDASSLVSATKVAIKSLDSYGARVSRAQASAQGKNKFSGFAKPKIIDLEPVKEQVSPMSKFKQYSRSAIKDLTNLQGVATVTITNTTAKVNKLNKAVQGFGNVLKLAGKEMSSFRNNSNNLLGNLTKSFVGFQIGKTLGKAVNESVNYVENLNLFQVAMGKSIDVGREFVAQMSEVFGMDPSSTMRHIGLFHQLAIAMEVPTRAAEKMSLGFTKIGMDIASVFNADVEKVMTDLTAGFQGMTRSVRKYGIDLRMSTLQVEASTWGLKGNVATMSEANRQALRYLVTIKQASNLNGDFAKTIESPANQLRVFGEQMRMLGRSIGNFLLIPLATVLPYINAVVMALRKLFEGLAMLAGFKPIDFGGAVADSKDDVVGLGNAVGDTTKKMNKMLASFDELNLLNKANASAGAGGGVGELGALDPRLAQALADTQMKIEAITMKANILRDRILSFFGLSFSIEGKMHFDSEQFEDNLKNKFPQWTQTIEALFQNWIPILRVVKSIIGEIKNIGGEMVQPFKDWFKDANVDANFAQFIKELPANLGKVSKFMKENREEIAKWANRLLLAWGVGKLVKPFLPILGGAFKLLGGILAGVSLSTLALWGGLALVVVGLVSAYNGNADFRASVDALWKSLKENLIPKLGELVTALGETFEALKPLTDELAKMAKDIWDGSLKGFLDEFILALSDVVGLISDLLEVVNLKMPTISQVLGNTFDGVTGKINSFINKLELGLTTIRFIVKAIKELTGLTDKVDIKKWMDKFGVPWGKVVEQGTAKVGKFASGGLPPTGQMFVARESGPELVGSMGGRTAVMNNEQIVTAVSQGVGQAVASAMSQVVNKLNQGNNGGETVLVVDGIEFGRVIQRSVTQLQRQTGMATVKV